jgi:hypothetical protein
MEKEFIPYQESLHMKELGFDEPCLAYWYNETPTNPEGQCLVYYKKPWDEQKIINGIIRDYYVAPLYQQALRWLRKEHNFVCEIIRKEDGNHSEFIGWVYIDDRKIDVVSYWDSKSYEEAELACLKKIIEIVKQ